MEQMNLRKPGIIRDFKVKNGNKTFWILNILLFAGSITIVSALVYILLNLERSDAIIIKALPFIVSGLVFVLFYAIGYHKLKENRNKQKPFKMLFMEKL
jgi:biotin transporter BioY